jgi:predicted DNA-binding protein (MmcQ/YjbR family)
VRDLESIQAYCQALPGTTEDIKWEHNLVFSVAEKMYALVALDQQPPHLCFRTTPELFEVLTQREGIIPAPYLARYKWVTAQSLTALSEEETKHFIKESYKMTVAKLPKRVRAALQQ